MVFNLFMLFIIQLVLIDKERAYNQLPVNAHIKKNICFSKINEMHGIVIALYYFILNKRFSYNKLGTFPTSDNSFPNCKIDTIKFFFLIQNDFVK